VRQRLGEQLAGLLAEKPLERERLGELWLEEAWSALRHGRIDIASAALERARRLPLDPEQACRWRLVAWYCGDSGRRLTLPALGALFGTQGPGSVQARYHKALGGIRLWMGRHRADPELLFEWADAAKAAGLRPAALEALGLTRSLPLDVAQVRRAADLYEALGSPLEARETLGRLLTPQEEGRLRDARLLLAVAEDAVRARHRPLALRCVAQARRQRLSVDDLDRAAIVYQEFGEYRRALDVLDESVRVEPWQARWRNDRGVLHMLMGMREAAVKDWQEALSRDPGFLPAVLSLGSLYAASGRRAEALKLYQDALRQPASDNPQKKDIQRRIIGERDRLLGHVFTGR
jgi:tetratricopeptide (TPR) repeat protein